MTKRCDIHLEYIRNQHKFNIAKNKKDKFVNKFATFKLIV